MARAEVVVILHLPLEEAVAAVTALGEFDLEDDDLGGAEGLREAYRALREALNMPEAGYVEATPEEPPEEDPEDWHEAGGM
jgi:hypothetical protein